MQLNVKGKLNSPPLFVNFAVRICWPIANFEFLIPFRSWTARHPVGYTVGTLIEMCTACWIWIVLFSITDRNGDRPYNASVVDHEDKCLIRQQC